MEDFSEVEFEAKLYTSKGFSAKPFRAILGP